ncbi:MAG TPA: hydrogenase maturation protease [Bryobacteraceae bacterium]|nr:hydrogenase maturation protease [Bryobacteraceae bacterium]
MTPRILVAGIGNIFLGDDAFGVEVARKLTEAGLPENVRVVDYGIRGFDLSFALMDDYDTFILIDAVPRGDAPGTLYTIEVDMSAVDEESQEAPDAHALDPVRVLRIVKAMGGRPKHVLLVGCEPVPLTEDEQYEGLVGLSAPVEAAVEEAVRIVGSLVNRIEREQQIIAAS